jgi:hypothetical protein
MVVGIRGGLGCMVGQGERCKLETMMTEILNFKKYRDQSDRGLILM